jgi:hypothetical protein
MTLELGYRIVQRADYPPNRCCVCYSDDRPLIDTGQNFPELSARVYLCRECVAQIAVHTLGLPGAAEFESVVRERDELRQTVAEATEKAETLVEEVEAIRTLQRKGFEIG